MDREVPFEIERKFLLPSFPPNLENQPYDLLKQAYLKISDSSEVRIRNSNSQEYTLTRKDGEGLVRGEEEIGISEGMFDDLWEKKIGVPIIKKRYHVLEKGVPMTIDSYEGELEGLVVAEAEFENESQAQEFQIPFWVKEEITGVKKYGNKSLALHSLDEFKKTENTPEKIVVKDESLKLFLDKIGKIKKEKQGTIVIGVGGRTSAGKTTAVISAIKEKFEGETSVISTDDFAKGTTFIHDQRKLGNVLNYDHPQYYDTKKARESILRIKKGQEALIPVFNFKKGEGEPDGEQKITPSNVVVIEGLYALSPDLFDLYDTTAFVDISLHGSIIRRLMRDINRTNMNPDQIFRYYLDVVDPMYKKYIEPTKGMAEFVINNEYNPILEAEHGAPKESQVKLRGTVSTNVLQRGGGEYVGEVEQQDLYFVFDTDTSKSHEIFRIRNDNARRVLTYKGPSVEGVTRDRARMEFIISEEDENALLSAATPVVEIRKKRHMYFLDGVHIALDSVTKIKDDKSEELGEFVEIHMPFDLNDKSGVLNSLYEKLGIDGASRVDQSYSEM